MNVIFLDKALEELYCDGKTTSKKYKKLCKNAKLVAGYQRAVKALYEVDCTKDLKEISFLHYEKLKKDKRSCLRILNGEIERLLFYETKNGIEVELIEIDNTHYGTK